MRPLLIVLCAPLFAQNFQSKLGTEAVDFQGGMLYGSGSGRAYTAVATKLRGGLTPIFSLYGEFGYSRVFREDLNFPPPTLRLRGSLMDITGGGELHFPRGRFQPFGLAGIGTVRDSGK